MTSPIDLARVEGGWMLPVEEQTITQLRFDYAVTLCFDARFDLRIEQSLVLTTGSGDAHIIDPEGPPREAAPVLDLSRAKVLEAKAFDDGRLELRFDNGASLTVDSGKQYEAWQFAGPNGLLVVSLPDGDLAIWRPGAKT